MKKIPSKKITPIPPKFNMMWIYIAVVLGFLALNYVYSGGGPKEINYENFEKNMLLSGDVDKLVAFKSNDLLEVEVFIKPDSLKDNPK